MIDIMTNYTGRVAAVLIPRTFKEEKYLIARRSDNGDWEFAGGKEDLDEDSRILDTAKREIQEELNLEINPQESKEDYSYKGGVYEIIPVYARHGYEDADQHLELEDHNRYRWIDPENIPTDIELGKEVKCLESFDLV